MKSLICLCALILAIGSAAPAHAYRINVLDPPTGTSITSEPFNVVFTPCPTNAHNGCFFGQNNTGSPITTLEIIFPNTGIIANQNPVCSPNVLSIYTTGVCQVINGFQVFFFSGLNIGTTSPSSDFLIEEEGLTFTTNSDGHTNIPAGKTFSPPAFVTPGAVPEPSSIVLLSTGLLLGGFFFGRKTGLIPASLRSR